MPTSSAKANELLQAARRARRSPSGSGRPLSRQELAEAVAAYLHSRHGLHASIDDGYIGKLERGEHRWPTARYREALCEVLGAPDASALGFYIIRGQRNQPPNHATTVHDIEDGDDMTVMAEHWLKLLKMFVTWTDSHDTSQLLMAAANQTQIIQAQQRAAHRPHGQLFTVQARWLEFLSWTADNCLRDQDAARWIGQAHDLALAAGDTRLASYTLMRRAQQLAEQGRGIDAVDLAIKARREFHAAAPRTQALAYVREAHGHALLGDARAAQAAIRQAHRVAPKAACDDPTELDQHCTPQYIAAYDALCQLLLGQPDSAARQFEQVLADKTAAARHDQALYRAWLSHAYRKLRRVDEAIDQYQQVYAMATTTGSVRVLRVLHTPPDPGVRAPSAITTASTATAQRLTSATRRRRQSTDRINQGIGMAG